MTEDMYESLEEAIKREWGKRGWVIHTIEAKTSVGPIGVWTIKAQYQRGE